MDNNDVFNKTKLIKEISARTNWDLSSITFWRWDKKYDFIKPFFRSATAVLVHASQVDKIIERLKKLHNAGKIRITVKV